MVKWGTDENGSLTPMEVVDVEIIQQELSIMCPSGVVPGQEIEVCSREFEAFISWFQACYYVLVLICHLSAISCLPLLMLSYISLLLCLDPTNNLTFLILL